MTMTMNEENQEIKQDENHLIAERRQKLKLIREKEKIAFPNDAKATATALELLTKYEQVADNDTLKNEGSFTLCGRMMAKRIMGKASFTHIQDGSGERFQLYVARDNLEEGKYAEFKGWDIGDIIEVKGYLFRTKTNELSIHAESIRLLVKSLRPLPEKFHGLTDPEKRYRQRYVDLIMNKESRDIFVKRSKIVSFIRNYFTNEGFLEVETPMMHPIPGGAAAKPFITHHNALDMDLYLRIAPELYLKRLVVGGLEKVFEINRSFRNEGIDTRHNPEFTMLEFYWAYANFKDLMAFSERLFRDLTKEILGTEYCVYQGEIIDFSKPFQKLAMKDAVKKYVPTVNLEDVAEMQNYLKSHYQIDAKETDPLKLMSMIFEEAVEKELIQPTFITDYPAVISPLSRRNDENPEFTDRFELFIAGRELSNGFSELNDAEDQAQRFKEQVKAREGGDDEAMFYDADFIRALEHAMPPTAGQGIGIDRLVMLLTDSPSIRDVLLFPQMRNENNE